MSFPIFQLGHLLSQLGDLFPHLIAEVFGDDYRFDIYDMRHRWAVRSIEANVNQSLCAQSMGHSLQMHEQRYQRWMTATDLRAAMAKLSRAA